MATSYQAQHVGHGGKTTITAEQKEQLEQGKIAHNFRFTELAPADKPAKTDPTGKPGANKDATKATE